MFLHLDHQKKFEQLLKMDGSHPEDIERRAMFFIFAGSKELADKVNILYDFENQMIKSEVLNETSLSSSLRALVALGFNLYNNSKCGTVVELFGGLDEMHKRLAINAICLRFSV